jgi:hypothetical protein
MEFKVGDPVRFNDPHGSLGRVTSIRRDGPFAEHPAYYVKWYYGKDKFGEQMTEVSGFYNEHVRHELVKITEEELRVVIDREGFST